MANSERCDCGARVMWCDVRSMDGKINYIYTCGVCRNQIEFVAEADPRRF